MTKFYTFLTRHWLGLVGIVVLFFYLASAFQLIDFQDRVFVILFLAISPVAIIGVYSIGNRLAEARNSMAINIAKIYGFIAFALFEAMLVIQIGSQTYFKEHLLSDEQSEIPKNIVKMIYKGVNSVQFTIDIAFDIFYCLTIILFAWAMFGDKRFGKAVGSFGVISGLGLLTLNLWTFPYPPAEAGLIDLGPLTGVWWAWVIVLLFKIERRERAPKE